MKVNKEEEDRKADINSLPGYHEILSCGTVANSPNIENNEGELGLPRQGNPGAGPHGTAGYPSLPQPSSNPAWQ